ncbi:MAG TPA: SDR family oxidoreductase, partial [Chloroflexota bacterium]|nr:SDR family oxidoreductase [Chloroflexota bacterium]
ARRADALEAAAAALAGGAPGRVLAVAADLSRPDDVPRVVAATLARWGRVDIAVNNVGGPPPGQPLGLTDAQWREAFELNFFSVVRLCREVVPGMRERGWGRVVNLLSLSVRQPEANLALSTAARLAVVAYARSLADEVARDGVTVNNVLPGSVATERLQAVAEMQARFHGRDVARAMDDRLALVPLGRFGQPEEVADLVCYLASERAGFLTGLSIPFDGGQLRATL